MYLKETFLNKENQELKIKFNNGSVIYGIDLANNTPTRGSRAVYYSYNKKGKLIGIDMNFKVKKSKN